MPWIRQNASVAQWLDIKTSAPTPGNRGFGVEVVRCDELQTNHVCKVSLRVKARAYSGEKLLAEYYEEEPYSSPEKGEWK